MKKVLYQICVMMIILFISITGKSYGFINENIEGDITIWSDLMFNTGTSATTTSKSMANNIKSNSLELIKEIFNYDQGTINEKMKFDTKITIKSKKKKTYTIQIGESYTNSDGYTYECTIDNISEDDLKNIYGATSLEEGECWDVVLIVDAKEVAKQSLTNINYYLELYLNSIYAKTGTNAVEDYNSGLDKDIENKEIEFEWEKNYFGGSLAEGIEGAINTVEEVSSLLNEIIAKFTENPVGTGFSYFMGLLRDGIGDTMQKITNTITFTDVDITYSESELTTAGSKTSQYNKYVNVSDYKRNGVTDEENQKIINIEKVDSDEEEDKRFSEKTEIPIIVVDLYNIAADNIPFLDINFLTVDEEKHPEGTPWRGIRDFITGIVHITMFVVAAFLIIMLIYNGIKIVTHSFDSPESKAEHKKAINKFITSLFMLVGSIVIMALCIYGSNMFLDDIKVNNSEEGSIRVNVEEAGYSFSTSILGFFRYMAEIDGVNRCLEKGMYTIVYIILSVVVMLITFIMAIRMLIMMILAIVGPILAGLYALNMKMPMKYSTWVKLYVILAAVQLVFVIIYKIIFNYAIPSVLNI